ncbi:helicase-related protein [uncultured Neglectibacter sp.]|uniref:helicase-related protein n=1 Tax=uncultured Neglectibacter sp. TaxID=1924108 RepID=UPI0034DE11F9
MPDYVRLLLTAINQFDPDNAKTADHLRDLVCWVSDHDELKSDPTIANLLYIASQKMRVFGYNKLNGFESDPNSTIGLMDDIGNQAIQNLYRSQINRDITLDKSQKEVIDLFQSLSPRRLLVSAPTSYGKTFLMREIVFLNRDRYKNILLVFPTVALLLENAGVMTWFVKKYELNYRIIKTVDNTCEEDGNKIFVFTPERALQLLASFPDLKIDFFFFDEVYKIDEDYCNDEMDENSDESVKEAKHQKNVVKQESFLEEDRGKTFRIALYLLSKRVDEYYLAGPNLSQDQFGLGMRRYLELNHITVKEILFEPTLRITVNAFTTRIEEKLPHALPQPENKALVHISNAINDKVKDVVSYISSREYGQTLLYCTTPAKAIEYSNKLSNNIGNTHIFETYPDEFKQFIEHIRKEYDVNNCVDEWSLIKVLKNGFGMHHGKLPKYIQREVLEQFNARTFNILFCTSTIVEGVNTDAKNMVILNPSKGGKKLSPFDIKNIKGRAGRYHHCFVGRVFYMSKELQQIEESDTLSLNFVTYSDVELGPIDLDNATYDDLTQGNVTRKKERDDKTRHFLLPEEVFLKNRTISKENQEKLLQKLIEDKEYMRYRKLLLHTVDVENFLKYRWITKILETYFEAGLIDKRSCSKYSAVANSYYNNGFKGILGYEIEQYQKGKTRTIDTAYSEAFKCLRGILEHKIPKILSLFEGIIAFVALQKGDNPSNFSLSNVRRYYETGVKSLLGESLIEYGFPTDAIRRIEEKYSELCHLDVDDAKKHCRKHYHEIVSLLDSYENQLFIKAMNSF